MGEGAASLQVHTALFIDTLSRLRSVTKGSGSLHLSLDGNELVISRGATTVSVPASGVWPGPVKVSVDMIGQLRKRAKLLDPVSTITVERGYLRISHYQIACR